MKAIILIFSKLESSSINSFKVCGIDNDFLKFSIQSKKELKDTKSVENVASKATTAKEYFFEPKHTKESPSWNENQANKQLNTVSNAASADQRSTINNEASHNSNSNNTINQEENTVIEIPIESEAEIENLLNLNQTFF